MTTASDSILGAAIFFTDRGLDAIGTGVLSGVGNTSAIFELRNADQRLSIFSANASPIVFRRTIAIEQTREPLDLIGVASQGLDSTSRPGFFGCCVAVKSRDVSGYREAYEYIADRFKQVTKNVLSNGHIKRPSADIFDSIKGGERYRTKTYIRLGNDEGTLVLQLEWKDESSLQLIYQVMGAYSNHPFHAKKDIIIVEQPVPGAVELDEAYVRELENSAKEWRQKYKRIAKRPSHSPPNRAGVIEDDRLVLRSLLARVEALESQVKELQRAQSRGTEVFSGYSKSASAKESSTSKEDALLAEIKARTRADGYKKRKYRRASLENRGPFYHLKRRSNGTNVLVTAFIVSIALIIVLLGFVFFSYWETDKPATDLPDLVDRTGVAINAIARQSTSEGELVQDYDSAATNVDVGNEKVRMEDSSERGRDDSEAGDPFK
ncbi:hypothetical protein F2Q65_17395 [Thiohalocapsa marina]|uniref:Uncharacterized protein n=1 Tax=Thiohalocapsa marina TaxID=424902 RepID=A0A5M8FDJ7_9GAMM|nr:hypothetical protein [Thiohalocapsa marina]KAA6182747.1 hypothetical protein F2Q65_17395 [Thiohalocapsa marina]